MYILRMLSDIASFQCGIFCQLRLGAQQCGLFVLNGRVVNSNLLTLFDIAAEEIIGAILVLSRLYYTLFNAFKD